MWNSIAFFHCFVLYLVTFLNVALTHCHIPFTVTGIHLNYVCKQETCIIILYIPFEIQSPLRTLLQVKNTAEEVVVVIATDPPLPSLSHRLPPLDTLSLSSSSNSSLLLLSCSSH